jgi:phosphohistidine phosphatase
MKTLIVVRHAKSSWAEPGLSDFDRPLNDRGKRDAPEMARRLQAKGLEPDYFVSSPARRARKTARSFAEVFGKDKSDVQLVEALYMATEEAFEETVAALPDKASTVLLFSHNPGITTYANSLTNVKVDDMPTCALLGVSADCDSWASFAATEKRFLFFDYPKNPLAEKATD